MIYYKTKKKDHEIYLVEDTFDHRYNLKTESVFAQCNGYMGIRASFETKSLNESRGMFITGFYHKAGEDEVTEIVNCPDLIGMQISINKEEYSLDRCKIKQYQRSINLQTGELKTLVACDLDQTKDIVMKTRRFVSRSNLHLVCHEVEITPTEPAIIQISTGINGQITNSGVSHFNKVEARVFDRQYMLTTNQCDDGQRLRLMTVCAANQRKASDPVFILKRRSIYGTYEYRVKPGETLRFTKYSYVNFDTFNCNQDESYMKEVLSDCLRKGYDRLYQEHREEFLKLWRRAAIKIKGATLEEEAAIAFAQYHLFGMTPSFTHESSVGAKGLTGEGYKGHVFWDTEIFIMPFFLHVFPEIARNLLLFRYYGLPGAREKAKDFGYEGAMYPWEVAKNGREVTPPYAAINIHTGVAQKVWSGWKEHHITADIIYALWNYYKLTKDKDFLDCYGYEMIIETATFWCSRASFHPKRKRYEILDVIGPDEYTEHIDNNAYTNYLAMENVKLAYQLILELKERRISRFQELNTRFQLDQKLSEWRNFIDKLYLPTANQEGIIPQDDTFLTKNELPNIEKYRQSDRKQSVLLDYSRDEIVAMQVLKQADVVMLLTMLPDLFNDEIRKKNITYYEQRTIHDSSLSYCAHTIAYAQIGDVKAALEFFHKSMEIDLNENYNDSTDGIHSAALGGIWNSVINGFAGLSHSFDYVEIKPHLPEHWEELQFYIMTEGRYVRITITKEQVRLSCELGNNKPLHFKVNNQIYTLIDTLEIPIDRNISKGLVVSLESNKR